MGTGGDASQPRGVQRAFFILDEDAGDEYRVLTRSIAIARAQAETAFDDDRWSGRYDPRLIARHVAVVRGINSYGVSCSLLEAIQLEREFPQYTSDVLTYLWMERLIDKQINDA